MAKLSKAMKTALIAVFNKDIRKQIEGRTARALIRRGLAEVKGQYIALTEEGERVAKGIEKEGVK